jgi:hypothetical protein
VIVGAWLDVGEGACGRCGDERRLYSPETDPTLRVCAPCTQPKAISSIPRDTEVGEEE